MLGTPQVLEIEHGHVSISFAAIRCSLSNAEDPTQGSLSYALVMMISNNDWESYRYRYRTATVPLEPRDRSVLLPCWCGIKYGLRECAVSAVPVRYGFGLMIVISVAYFLAVLRTSYFIYGTECGTVERSARTYSV